MKLSPNDLNPYNVDLNIKRYAEDLARVDILDQQTEQELFILYRETGDVTAKEKLLESGLRFVITLAHKYAQNMEQHKALILAGNEGLLVALDKYEVGHGTRFLSYAAWWVLLQIREESNRFGVVSIPVWRKKAARKIKDVHDRLLTKTGEKPRSKDIVQKDVPFSQSQVEKIMDNEFSEISLDDDPTAIDTHTWEFPQESQLSKMENLDSEKLLANKSGVGVLKYIISCLPARDKFILQAYYGFLTDKPMSLKQIATVMNLSPERVRQIKLHALGSVKNVLKRYGISGLEDVLDV